jgi:hypothetical protein
MRSTQILALVIALLSGAAAESGSSGRAAIQGRFSASNGDVIELDTSWNSSHTTRTKYRTRELQ